MKNAKVILSLLFFFFFIPFSLSIGLEDNLLFHYSYENSTDDLAMSDTRDRDMFIDSGQFTTGFFGNGITFNDSKSFSLTESLVDYTGGSLSIDQFLAEEPNSFDRFDNFTFSAWVFPTEYNSDRWNTIMGFQGVFEISIRAVTTNQGFLQSSIEAASGDANIFRSTSNTILTNEWTHIAVTYNPSTNFTMYINSNPVTSITNIFRNNVGKTVSSTPPNVGGSSLQWSSYGIENEGIFNGTIDEISYWYGRELSQSEINQLYNGGSGVNFDAFSLEDPLQLASFPPVTIESGDIYDIFTNGFFTDYSSISLSFESEEGLQSVFLTADIGGSSQSYAESGINVTLLPVGNDIRIRFIGGANDFQQNIFITASNSIGSTTDSFILTNAGIQSVLNQPPEQIRDFASPIELSGLISVPFNMNNHFSNYNGISVTFNNQTNNLITLNTTFGGPNQTYADSGLQVQLIRFTEQIILAISTNETTFESTFVVNATNTFGTTTDWFVAQINPLNLNLSSAPELIQTVGPLFLEPLESYEVKFSNYFTNYFTIATQFEDRENGANVFIAGDGDSYTQHPFFNITGTDDGFIITSGETAYSQTFTLSASNNIGTTNVNQVINFADQVSTGLPDDLSDQRAGEFTTSIFRTLVEWFSGLFPNAESLSIPVRFAYVIFTLLITLGLFIYGSYDLEGLSKVVTITIGIVMMLVEIIFFVAIDYIPVIIIIIISLVASVIAYVIIKNTGVGGV